MSIGSVCVGGRAGTFIYGRGVVGMGLWYFRWCVCVGVCVCARAFGRLFVCVCCLPVLMVIQHVRKLKNRFVGFSEASMLSVNQYSVMYTNPKVADECRDDPPAPESSGP